MFDQSVANCANLSRSICRQVRRSRAYLAISIAVKIQVGGRSTLLEWSSHLYANVFCCVLKPAENRPESRRGYRQLDDRLFQPVLIPGGRQPPSSVCYVTASPAWRGSLRHTVIYLMISSVLHSTHKVASLTVSWMTNLTFL